MNLPKDVLEPHDTFQNPPRISSQHQHPCRLKDLGLIDYPSAYSLQQQAVQEALQEGVNTLFFCEHRPVFTLGRLAQESNFLLSKNAIEKKGTAIVRINRGGEVTFHGPGQVVVYPIFRLEEFGKDLKGYMEKLEEVAVDFLGSFGIVAKRIEGRRGVWVEKKKIASIGIGVRKWVSFHGMAVNVNTDLEYFRMIKPCGLDVTMTSVGEILNQMVDLSQAKKTLAACFKQVFHLKFI